jgi:formylglycine-generating enzyme required for sulfatase activity
MRQRTWTIISVAAVLAMLGATARAATIDLVPVGNAGNPSDMRYAATPGYGSVGYAYAIGKYEVTAGQYKDFLNAVGGIDTYALYNTEMSRTDCDLSGSGGVLLYGCGIARSGGGTVGNPYSYTVDSAFVNRPVNHVSFWDAARFANWLHNGQPSGLQGPGTTERGAYTLDGYNGADGHTITKNDAAQWWIPSEDEWYKAAYHKNDGTTGNYWDYPTKTDLGSPPGRDMTELSNPGNNANVFGLPFPIDGTRCTTVKGEFELSDSAYHTFDQGGNVWEWNDTVMISSTRGWRGGAFDHFASDSAAFVRDYEAPTVEYYGIGFRVASVPEPCSLVMLAAIALGGLLYRRSKHA